MMSVSGHEQRELKKIKALFGDVFDEIIADAPGNIILVKKCGRENAPKILVDTHFDEIGFFVSGICEGGFLSFVPIGGVDPAILQASASAQKAYGYRNQVGLKPNPILGYQGAQLADAGTDQHLSLIHI